MKKRVFVLLCVVFLVGTLSGCSNQDVGASCNEIVKACSDVAEEGSFDIWVSYGEDLYEESFSGMYGVQYDMLQDGAILYTEEGGKADEISIMRLKKADDVSIAKSKLEDRITQRRKVFEGYKPEEVSKLDQAYVMVQGNYVALIISEDSQKFETEIRKMISEGAE